MLLSPLLTSTQKPQLDPGLSRNHLRLRKLLSTMALNLTGTCTCKKLQYTVRLDSADSARTSLCHCLSCKKAFGTNYGLTSKACTRPPLAMLPQKQQSSYRYSPRSQSRASNTAKGSQSCTSRRMALYESFAKVAARSCANTGYVFKILIHDLPEPPKDGLIQRSRQEQAADKFRYVTYGTLDDPEKLPPKGEFFCKERSSWMPEIPGLCHQLHGSQPYAMTDSATRFVP